MRVEVTMPQMGESVAEGTIVRWRKQQGDPVGRDEALLDISTDKVDAEVPAPEAGVLVEVVAHEGTKVPVGSVLAYLETDASKAASAVAAGAPPPAAPKPQTKAGPATPEAPRAAAAAGPVPTATAEAVRPEARGNGDERPGRFYSPLVRSIARKEGISVEELATIQGSGLGGRVTKNDVIRHLSERSGRVDLGAMQAGARPGAPPPAQRSQDPAPATAEAPRPAPAPAPVPGPAPAVPAAAPAGRVEVVAMDAMRRAIAEHMVRSVHTSPHVTSIHEVDMTRIARIRESGKSSFAAREGFNLTFMPFVTVATAQALREFPYVNASVEGNDILLRRDINVGIAVAMEPSGLIVPVVKQADGLSFVGVARQIDDLARRARSRKLAPDDVAGGTFTITNIGAAGTLAGTPIISQPQVAILGVGAIQKRPVVVDDSIAIRSMMYLTLSYDHRVVDGMLAGRFLGRVTRLLETFDENAVL